MTAWSGYSKKTTQNTGEQIHWLNMNNILVSCNFLLKIYTILFTGTTAERTGGKTLRNVAQEKTLLWQFYEDMRQLKMELYRIYSNAMHLIKVLIKYISSSIGLINMINTIMKMLCMKAWRSLLCDLIHHLYEENALVKKIDHLVKNEINARGIHCFRLVKYDHSTVDITPRWRHNSCPVLS